MNYNKREKKKKTKTKNEYYTDAYDFDVINAK